MKPHSPLLSLKWRSGASIALVLLASYYHDIKSLKYRLDELEENNICSVPTEQNESEDSITTPKPSTSAAPIVRKILIQQPQYEPYLWKKENKLLAKGGSTGTSNESESEDSGVMKTRKIASEINQECRNLQGGIIFF